MTNNNPVLDFVKHNEIYAKFLCNLLNYDTNYQMQRRVMRALKTDIRMQQRLNAKLRFLYGDNYAE